MAGITIRWREGEFDCAFVVDRSGGALSMWLAAELIHEEPVASAAVAGDRARELSRMLTEPRAKHA